MNCQKCNLKAFVVDSRRTMRDTVTRRRYKCSNCGHRVTTYELVAEDNFNRNSCFTGIIAASVENGRVACLKQYKNEQGGIIAAIDKAVKILNFAVEAIAIERGQK